MFVVKKGLKGSVLKWLQITMGELNDYVLFKKHFGKHYWGIRQQNQIRIEITQGKYNPKGNMSMIDYFMGIISKAKNLEPAMSDQELISLIIPHFPDHIRNNLYIAKPLDFGEMIDLLTQFESSRNYNNTPTNYFGNSADKSLSQDCRSENHNFRGQWARPSSPKSPDNRARTQNFHNNRFQNSRNGNDRNNDATNNHHSNRNRQDRRNGGHLRQINHLNIDRRSQRNNYSRNRQSPHWLRNRGYSQGYWRPNFSNGQGRNQSYSAPNSRSVSPTNGQVRNEGSSDQLNPEARPFNRARFDPDSQPGPEAQNRNFARSEN